MVSGNELQQDELPSQSSVISRNGKESLALPREDRTAPQSSPNVALPKCAGALCFLNTLPFPLFLHDLFKQIFMFVGICYLYTEGEREFSSPIWTVLPSFLSSAQDIEVFSSSPGRAELS